MAGAPRPRFAAALVLIALCVGCADRNLRRCATPELCAAWEASAVRGGELSPRTWQTLRQLDLDTAYRRDPSGTCTRLHALAVQNPQPDWLFALAEINFLLGVQGERADDLLACGHYYLCAGYAYHFLFPEHEVGLAPPVSRGTSRASLTLEGADDRLGRPFDPRFRLACDLYNAALAKCIRRAQRVGKLDPRRELRLPGPGGSDFTLSLSLHDFAWKPEDFGALLLCADYRVSGLQNHHRTFGLGVPLIAVRTEADPARDNLPPGVSFPATAFFRFDGGLSELASRRSGRLELHNPLQRQNIAVRGRPVPLETDLTTPLTYFLDQSRLDDLGLLGFLRVDQVQAKAGIYFMEPYQPGKIPVLMVHGLLSSPITWAPLFNDLQADPQLRQRYQFWFYLYPTGNPYLVTAADLRQSLERLRQTHDPRRQDPALDQMVLCGHSMGGLVSRLLVEGSGNDFWKLVSERPFNDVKTREATRGELQRVFFFEPQSSVRRVVFLGTPHRGSGISPSRLGRLGSYFVRLPMKFMDALQELGPEGGMKSKALPTSVDLLAPGSPALELLAARPRPAGVHFHSVVGLAPSTKVVGVLNFFAGSSGEPGDGVVPVASARLASAESEVQVPADHFTVHHHPKAVLEVRRILLEHLAQLRENGVQPAFRR